MRYSFRDNSSKLVEVLDSKIFYNGGNHEQQQGTHKSSRTPCLLLLQLPSFNCRLIKIVYFTVKSLHIHQQIHTL